jgi:methyl-accepting chemotaxis protein
VLLEDAENSVSKMNEVETDLQEEITTLSETVDAFRSLYDQMDHVKSVSEQIDALAEELVRVKNIVTNSVTSLTSVTQESAAATEETSANMQIVLELVNDCSSEIRQLLNTSKDLKGHVQRFQF